MSDHRMIRARAARAARATARLRSEQSGLTLVEALVAAMVLLIGIVPTIKVFDDSRDQNATGERHQIALLQAEQALEEMRGLPYDRLLLDATAADPGGGRVTAGASELRIRSDLMEPIVTASTEGVSVGDAWVEPVTQVTTGASEAPVEMTVHRFVTWRDEECGVVDLGALGLDLPGAIDRAQTPLSRLLGGVIGGVLGLLTSGGLDLERLETRLEQLNNALAANEAVLADAVAGITELDLCDLDIAAVESLLQLDRLTPGLQAVDALNDRLISLEDALGQSICLLGICVLDQAQETAVDGVNDQLDCLFGAGSGGTNFDTDLDTYLGDLASGLSTLGGDLADTQKNTKRITVAVVIEDRSGAGPFEPVWATSVVRDPAAGLVTEGAAACS